MDPDPLWIEQADPSCPLADLGAPTGVVFAARERLRPGAGRLVWARGRCTRHGADSSSARTSQHFEPIVPSALPWRWRQAVATGESLPLGPVRWARAAVWSGEVDKNLAPAGAAIEREAKLMAPWG